MKRVKLSLITAAIGIALSQSVSADDLLAVYNLSAQNDPQIRAAYADRSASREAKPQAIAVLVPRITARLNVTATDQEIDSDDIVIAGIEVDTDSSEDFENYGYSLDITQKVYDHALFVGLKIADADVARAEAEYTNAEQILISRVTRLYFDVLAQYENLKFREVEKEATSLNLEQTQQRFEVGLIAITDVNEAQARYDLNVADEIQAKNEVSNALEELREVTDNYHSTLNTLGESFHLISPIPADLNEWSDFAITRNPLLRAAEYAAEAAREGINQQRAGHYPTVDFVGNLTYDKSNQAGAFNPELEQNSISVQVTVPIFQGGLVSSRTRQAAHAHESAKEQLIQQRREVISGTRQAFLSVMTNIARARALEQTVKSNKSALDATKAGFEVGTRNIVDVLNAQTSYHDTIRLLAIERYAYIVNTVSLKQNAGVLGKADVQQINSWLSNKVSVRVF